MRELLYWVLEKMVGKDVVHYKVNIQLGAIVVLIAVTVWGAVLTHSLYWQWNDIKYKVQIVPTVTSNIITSVVGNNVDRKLENIESSQKSISRQIQQLSNDDKQRDRKIDRIDDYLFDKMGTKLDFNNDQTNKYEFVP